MENIVTVMDITSFATSIASLVLAIMAIWLSIYFFKMSSSASNEIKRASDDISSSVNKLEELFNKMYSDTFTMLKDTVSDMRKNYYHNNSLQNINAENKKIQEEINNTSKEVSKEVLSKIKTEIKILDIDEEKKNKLEELTRESLLNEINNLIKKLDQIKHKSSVNYNNRKEEIIKIISSCKSISLKELSQKTNIKENHLAIRYLFSMRANNEITWDGDDSMISSDSKIRLVNKTE